MTTRSWIRKLFDRTPGTVHQAPPRFRPRLEALEDRLAPSVSAIGNPASASDYNSSLSIPNFSVPAGTDRLLVLGTGGDLFNGSVSSLTFTFGGSAHALTKALSQSTSFSATEIWYLPLGNSDTPTTGDVSISLTGLGVVAAVATAFSGVNQTATITGATASGSAASALAVASTPGDMVLDTFSSNDDIYPSSAAPGDGQTLQGQFAFIDSQFGGVSTTAGAASVTMSWSSSSFPATYCHAAIDIPAAPSPTTTAVSAPASTYGTNASITVTVSSSGGTPTGNVSLTVDGGTPRTQALSGGSTLFSIPGLRAGDHTLSASFAAQGTFDTSSATGTLTVAPAPLSASGVSLSATAGAPFSGTVATFTTPDQIDGAAAFTAAITWGDGSTSAGVVSGSAGRFTVSGGHTYAAAGSYAVSVQITNPNTLSATASDTATVASLGQGVVKGLTGTIGFWQNAGQALIDGFNGGPAATALATWLAASFPNLYGASAGANNLAGKSNAQVAAFYLSQFALSGTKVEAEVLATALSVYASTSALGGNAGAAYGFSVSATGLGARSYSVGGDGAAFGVANNAVCDVYQLLQAVNQKAVKGVPYGGNTTLRKQAADLFSALDQAGSIG
jgi:hypothetical protein